MKKSLHRLLILAIIIAGMFVVISNRKVHGQGDPGYGYGLSQFFSDDERCWEMCP